MRVCQLLVGELYLWPISDLRWGGYCRLEIAKMQGIASYEGADCLSPIQFVSQQAYVELIILTELQFQQLVCGSMNSLLLAGKPPDESGCRQLKIESSNQKYSDIVFWTRQTTEPH
jgi:hypothetical protein